MNKIFYRILCMCFLLMASSLSASEENVNEDSGNTFTVHSEYQKFVPNVIAVLPMENLSLESEVDSILYNEVFEKLKYKGYRQISVESVMATMGKLGIQTPGQIAGFSFETLGKELKCDAVMWGGIEQAADIHNLAYDAIVVSCSLYLIDCKSGDILWECSQWRAAHRQFQLDPINAIINLFSHMKGSRKERIAWLAQEMLGSLPQGKVEVKIVDPMDDLLNKAIEIEIETEEN